MQRIRQAWKNEKGLTLVELLAVVIILGIIAAIAVPSIGGIIENSKRDAHIANAQQMVNSAKLVAISELSGKEDGTYIVTLDFLVDQGYLEPVEDPFSGLDYDSIRPFDSHAIGVSNSATDNSFVEITKNGNSIEYKVTLDASENKYDISGKTENELTREDAFN